MQEFLRKVLLPVFQLTEITTEDDPRALKRIIAQKKGQPPFIYHYRYVWDDLAKRGFNYNLLPVVLDRNARPWIIGNLFILSELEGIEYPEMTTFHQKADDLGEFKKWLDSQDCPEELIFDFPKNKLRRPTYRYRGHLQRLVQAGELEPSTASRRMGAVVAFYRWLIKNGYFQPENPPWEEKQYQIPFTNDWGHTIIKKAISTDVNIRVPKSEDPFEGCIQDGEKLRPLTGDEQKWILEAAETKGNSECYLIQLFILATGARIQTACTLRLRNFLEPKPHYSKSLTGAGEVFKLKAGPGTGIDTKNNKKGVLQIPRPIYELLHIYSLSERVKTRQDRYVAKHGAHDDPYLFVTQHGNPYFNSKEESLRFDPNFKRRHRKVGQTVRQFLTEHSIPFVREHYNPNFHYRIHDLRASYGMNMTELLMELVRKQKITFSRARSIVRELLWHKSFEVTDRYLNYRSQMGEIYEAVNSYGEQLQQWTEQARKGLI